MNKAELIERITLEGLTLGDGMVNDERIANRILALCEPYYREIVKEAVNSERWNEKQDENYLHPIAGERNDTLKDVLKAINDAMGGE